MARQKKWASDAERMAAKREEAKKASLARAREAAENGEIATAHPRTPAGSSSTPVDLELELQKAIVADLPAGRPTLDDFTDEEFDPRELIAFDGLLYPDAHPDSPISLEAYVAEGIAGAELALANGAPNGLDQAGRDRVARARDYATWRWHGFHAGVVVSL